MTAVKYYCKGKDHENLTKQVYDAILSKPEPRTAILPFFSKKNKNPLKWRVLVICSQGHENIFEGEYPKPPKGDFVCTKVKKVL